MKRRTAIRNLTILSAGTILFPACDNETFTVYEHLPLEKKQFRLIRQIQDTLLPNKTPEFTATESPLDFLLTMLNDCYKMKDVEKYMAGITEYQNYLSTNLKSDFKDLTPEQKLSAVQFVPVKPEAYPSASFFINVTKDLTVRHFVQSKYYQLQQMDFEFVPGRYLGCAAV